MRAHTVTAITRPKPKACQRAGALVLVLSSLVIPATASAQGDYSTLNAILGGEAQQSEPSPRPSGHPSVNAVLGAEESPTSAASPSSSPSSGGFPSVNAVAGGDQSPAPVVEVRESSGFEWDDAALGAGGALALLALSGVVFLAVRRRMAVSPTTASMS